MTNYKLLGTCTLEYFFLPDTEELNVSYVTTTVGNTTAVYQTSTTIYPTTRTLNSTTFTSTTIISNDTGFVLTDTTTYPYSPSAEWSVAACTFAP
jgi:hypothetical protein